MDAITAVLPNYPFFAGLSRECIETVARCGRKQSIAGGTVLFFAGDHADTLYVVLQGRIDLRVHRPEGSALYLDTVKGGDVVGWSWLVEPYRWMFDAVAVQDTELLAFDGDCLRYACNDDAAFGFAFLTRVTRLMHDRLDATRTQLIHGVDSGCDGRS